jgi:hypothetical protein
MQITVLLKGGQAQVFRYSEIQKKNGGTVLAIYDQTTYRITAEFSMEMIVACHRSEDCEQEVPEAG